MRRASRTLLTKLVSFLLVGLFLVTIFWAKPQFSRSKSDVVIFQKRALPENFSHLYETKKLKDIVCVNFKGRLGNLMIEYIFLYVIAKVKHLYPIVPENSELLNIFEIEKTTLPNIKKPANSCAKLPVYTERWGLSYDEKLLEVPPNKGVRFDGFYQSWKYWKKYEEEVRTFLRFKEPIRHKAHEQMRNIMTKFKFDFKKDSVIVSIHIRRGDYATKQHYEYGKLTPNEKYYANAMQYFKTKYRHVLFVVGSNDIAWSKKALANEKNVYFSEGNTPAGDMALLSLSNHTIMSVGTYGWWIGWMASGTTIYYKNIFRPGSDFAKEFRNLSIDDFVYPGWIPME